ncbi:hypothetical protein ACWIDW_04945 [Microbacterium sp. NPDC055312]
MDMKLSRTVSAMATIAELVGKASLPHSGWVSLEKAVLHAFSGVHPTSGASLRNDHGQLINLMADMEALLKDDGHSTELEVRRSGRYLHEGEQLIRWSAAYELIREYNSNDAARHFIEREIGISNMLDMWTPGNTGRLNSPQTASTWEDAA